MKPIANLYAVALLAAALPLAGTAAAQAVQVTSGSGQRAIQLAYGAPLGQSFTAIGTGLTSFGFRFETLNPGTANLPVTLTLRAGDGTGGASIATSTLTPAGIGAGYGSTGWVDFAFSGVPLVAGQTYSAVLTTSSTLYGMTYGPDINIYTAVPLGGDAYAGGRALGALFASDPICRTGICDADFRFTATNLAAAAPEPATWATMIAGFALAGLTLRRRRAVPA